MGGSGARSTATGTTDSENTLRTDTALIALIVGDTVSTTLSGRLNTDEASSGLLLAGVAARGQAVAVSFAFTTTGGGTLSIDTGAARVGGGVLFTVGAVDTILVAGVVGRVATTRLVTERAVRVKAVGVLAAAEAASRPTLTKDALPAHTAALSIYGTFTATSLGSLGGNTGQKAEGNNFEHLW